MTAPLERPAGRPTSSARPAGARKPPITADEHGTLRGVRWHRMTKVPTCTACRRAAADQRAAQRKRAYLRRGDRLVDSCGVRRRLNALVAIGWSQRALAAELGCDRSNVRKLLSAQRSTPETVAAVRAVYDRLSMTPGPHRQARAYAERHGWPPPLAWDDDSIDDPAATPLRGGSCAPAIDEVAVHRAMRGRPADLRPAERTEAVRRLTEQGLSAAQIAERLQTTQRSINRHRANLTRRSA